MSRIPAKGTLPPGPLPMRGHGARSAASPRPSDHRPSDPGALAQKHAAPPPTSGAAVAGVGQVRVGQGGGPPPLEGAVLPFRRTAVKPRRKRRSLWLRLLRPVATALLLVAMPVAAGYWILTSSDFALAEVDVRGNARVDDAWVRDRLAPLMGRNLVRIPLTGVEASLQGHPWIASVSIQKRLPDGLTVEVEERRAAVLVPAPGPEEGQRPDGGADSPLWLADAAGRPITEAPPEAADELVLVVPAPERGAVLGPLADTVPGAVEVARAFSRSQPVWAAGLQRIEALGQGEYRLVTAALPFPLLVRAGEVERRVALLEAALPGLRRELGSEMDDMAVADLRFTDRLVLRPAAVAASGAMAATSSDALTTYATKDTATPDARRGGDPRKKVG